MSKCDKCSKEVPLVNDASVIQAIALHRPILILLNGARHFLPVEGCEGSPSRALAPPLLSGKPLSDGWYDNFDEITRFLEDRSEGLSHLIRLDQARGEANYIRRMQLHSQFIVWGRFKFDRCGNILKFKSPAPADVDPTMPAIMTEEQFLEWERKTGYEENGLVMAWLPNAGMVCRCCGKPFTIKEAHLIFRKGHPKTVSLDNYTGHELGEIPQIHETEDHGELYSLFNRNFLRVSGQEWAEVPASHIIASGEEVQLFVYEFYHEKCLKRKEKAQKAQAKQVVLNKV